jgi:hypothetical protein
VQETEEFPLLEAIAREWLLETQQAGKRLSVMRKMWRSTIAL